MTFAGYHVSGNPIWVAIPNTDSHLRRISAPMEGRYSNSVKFENVNKLKPYPHRFNTGLVTVRTYTGVLHVSFLYCNVPYCPDGGVCYVTMQRRLSVLVSTAPLPCTGLVCTCIAWLQQWRLHSGNIRNLIPVQSAKPLATHLSSAPWHHLFWTAEDRSVLANQYVKEKVRSKQPGFTTFR